MLSSKKNNFSSPFSSSDAANQNKPKRKPHFKGNKPASATSGRGRTGAPKKKKY